MPEFLGAWEDEDSQLFFISAKQNITFPHFIHFLLSHLQVKADVQDFTVIKFLEDLALFKSLLADKDNLVLELFHDWGIGHRRKQLYPK